jgi:putative oxidoreductase
MNISTVRKPVDGLEQLRKEHAAASENPLAAKLQRVAPLAGRAAISAIFLLSAAGKLADYSGTAGYMASKGMPFVPFFLVMAILFELAGGLSVLLGYKARIGAAALIVFLIPATLIFHNFWAYQGMEQQMQMINFLKNVAIMGGLTLLIAFGSGNLSLDRRNTVRA